MCIAPFEVVHIQYGCNAINSTLLILEERERERGGDRVRHIVREGDRNSEKEQERDEEGKRE